MCFKKPKKIKVNRKIDYTWNETVARWKIVNPKNDYGGWYCYLKISPQCIGFLDDSTLTLEHVIPKSRGKKYKYDVSNIKPSCVYCNSLKGSRTIKALSEEYPHLKNII